MDHRTSFWNRTAGALLALALARGADAAYGASGYGGAALTADQWPAELVRRPLTLAPGMLEVQAPLALDLSAGAPGSPAAVPLALHAGVTGWLTVGLGYARGFCRSAAGDACPAAYDALRVDATAAFYAAGPFSAAYGVALASSTAHGLTALSAEAQVAARLAFDRFALALSPSYGFGLDHRESGSRIVAATFPLASSLAFGASAATPNRETFHVPLTAEVQVAPRVALAAGVALDGVADPVVGSLADTRRVPAGLAAVVTPVRTLDVGAGVTFPDLVPRGGGIHAQERVFEVFLAFRPGGGGPGAPSVSPPASHDGAEAMGPAAAASMPAARAGDALTIVIDGFAFSPPTLEVPPGATVTVRNADEVPHSVTSERAPGAFEPGAVAGVSFDTGAFTGVRTFTIPETAPPGAVVPFFCSVHRGSMRTPNGEIRVVGTAGGAGGARTASAR
ncbi:MAG TPA: hypothetical protein VFP65_24440 [Anaeromyxobacteraceae bacterium]|nr:hypothetical protein [Anaeromyxobacteraceae bacterium]